MWACFQVNTTWIMLFKQHQSFIISLKSSLNQKYHDLNSISHFFFFEKYSKSELPWWWFFSVGTIKEEEDQLIAAETSMFKRWLQS